MWFRLLAKVFLGAHFLYLVYLVFGGFLAWRWPRTIWLHVAAAAWGLALVALTLPCPLTWGEDWARRHGGQPALTSGFIDRYIEGVVYPARYTGIARAVAAVAVLVSWIGLAVIARRGADRARPGRLPVRRRGREPGPGWPAGR